jgi:hypothetical protein
MKVLIINYNRLRLSSELADWVSARGCEPIFIDNNSKYPPLLKYYKQCPYQVVRMKENYNSRVVWEQGLLKRLNITGNYIVTDPDLDLTGIPDDFEKVLSEGLQKYPQFDKCGFSLEIEDILNDKEYCKGKTIKEWESQFWKKPLDDLYFEAWIDTTFAMYKSDRFTLEGIRTNRPYTARHIPWYYKTIPSDERFYFRSAINSYTKNIL